MDTISLIQPVSLDVTKVIKNRKYLYLNDAEYSTPTVCNSFLAIRFP